MDGAKPKNKAIGQRLADMRKQRGWSQGELAQRLHALQEQENTAFKAIALWGENGKQAISQLERGARGLTIDIAAAYAEVFGVSLDYVVCRTDSWQQEHVSVKDMLGLSDAAIAVLRDYKENADILAAYERDPDPVKLYKKYGGESSQRLMRGRMAVSCLRTLNTLIEKEQQHGLIYNMFCYIFGRFGRKEKTPYPEGSSDYQKELLDANIEVRDKATGRDALIPYELLSSMFLAQVQTGLTRLRDEEAQ